ncbi:hypothetical protein [Streptomyces sp. 2A115]|uniref:hypothetical protein n=1 Tax=Streptomyces sp. 2A115 TaxID=3457439 RepID=UPI003FD51DD1
MIRAARVLPLLLLPLLLVSCGTEKAGAGADSGAGAGSGAGADSGTGGAAVDPAELAARAQALGVAPELVYVTEVPGFTVAQQSVGVYGGDGFSAAYSSQEARSQFLLFVDRGTLTAESCPKEQVGEAAGDERSEMGVPPDGVWGKVTCERDGDAWYRKGPNQHEYAIPRDGHVIRLNGDVNTVHRAVLRKAADSVHQPNTTELTALLPPAPAGAATEPVERGDLPPVGDGAPDNEVGATG